MLMQYTKSEEVYTDEAEGPSLQLIFLNIELRGGILFNASRGDVLSCFNKMNKKSQKKTKKKQTKLSSNVIPAELDCLVAKIKGTVALQVFRFHIKIGYRFS